MYSDFDFRGLFVLAVIGAICAVALTVLGAIELVSFLVNHVVVV